MVKITEDEIREMVRGIYYSNKDTGEHWQPFEHYEKGEVEELVENDVFYWMEFLRKKGGVIFS